MSKSYLIGIIILICGVAYVSLHSYAEKSIDFNNEIRPILNKNCLICHGGVRQNADLSFLFPENAILPAKSGKYAIVPGKPGKSELIKRVKHHDAEQRMPPEHNALSAEEISLLEKWISQGARWSVHWSYVPLSDQISIPKQEDSWCNNKIDHFILEKIRSNGLTASERAEKTTLLRRLYLDLIGLPPMVEERENFMLNTAPDAYEQEVDKLLSSPHFGERWASMWLDLARYADSRGYQKDLLRPEMWRYRDWVIHAFNEDLPFDQFTIDQLAGDLIPDRTENQILATAFHRNTMTNDEGGTNDEEFRVSAVIDRVNTTMEVWQATTIACVQCHSHPYDPIRHEEYYQLYSFFNNTSDKDDYKDSPAVTLFSPAQLAAKNKWKKELTRLENARDTVSPNYQLALRNFLDILPGNVPVMQENPKDSGRVTHVFERGNWLVHGDQVTPDVPGFMPEMDDSYPENRLGLAMWLVDKRNPLTARVMVNRFWEQLFGQGIVSTLEDFGTQGEKPSHPELLDWLAGRFMNDHQWSTKSLLKEMVLSATYQQTSAVTKLALEKDPNNIFLSRGPRYRLSAEQIRDQALTISGLLNAEVHGKSMMPFQPEGVWNVIRHAAKWEQGKGSEAHRRALYTFWRRVSPYPSMLSFDTPSRELCVSRRIRTNTPLQALITLNDPVFVEASEALATRMMTEGGPGVENQLKYGFQLALMYPPDEFRLNNLTEFYYNTLEYIKAEREKKKPKEVHTMSPEEESMINTASIILNLDEVIMKT